MEIIRWTYHKRDPVPAEVEFCQSLQASKARDTRDLIASQIEHPQVCEVAKILNVMNLGQENIYIMHCRHHHWPLSSQNAR